MATYYEVFYKCPNCMRLSMLNIPKGIKKPARIQCPICEADKSPATEERPRVMNYPVGNWDGKNKNVDWIVKR
jgi:hypothetical protein